jgi:hypothetical protein
MCNQNLKWAVWAVKMGNKNVAIILFPEDSNLDILDMCVACGGFLQSGAATIGIKNTGGRQVFACNEHYKNPHYINGWVDFCLEQRCVLEEQAAQLFFEEVHA